MNTSQKNIRNSDIRPPFPPVITAQDLIPAEISSKAEIVRIPNAFIAYRMALVRELKSQNIAYHRSNVSSLASRLWAEESKEVKDIYRKMTTDAQILYNQARGLTFLSYEQSTSTDNVIQDETNSDIIHINNPSKQDIEAKLLVLLNLQIQTLQQKNQMLGFPTYLDSNNGNNFASNFSSSSATLPFNQFNQFNHRGSSFNGDFMGNITGNNTSDAVRNLEQCIQILEQQMALIYQLWFGNYNAM